MSDADQRPFPPVFATNRPDAGETVASEINRLLHGLRTNFANPPQLAFATAYMNPQGFELIADEVEKAPHVRLLLGADPDEPYRSRSERGEDVSFNEVARVHLSELERDRDLLGFTAHADAAAHRLVHWLRSMDGDGQSLVEVRRFTSGFLHGKAYIADHPTMPAVLAGSSNLTLAGLSWNRELNLGYPSGQYTGLVVNWFNELWEASSPFDLAALYEARWQAHSPGVVFLRMLYELYGDGSEAPVVRIELPVTQFQKDGIVRAERILESLGGVLVCDEVGLGKTFIAGEFIKTVSQKDRQQVLIVVPAALKESTWEPFLNRFDLISARVKLVTYDDVRIGTKRGVRPEDLDDYSLVVIDEAHTLRNPNTLTAEAVMELLWGEHPKKVLLLTATPVNNSLRDLQTLISYFVRNDAHFASIGIPSIIDYIKEAQAQDPDTLSPEHLFDLMDRVAVRRTRRFVKQAYLNDRIFNNVGELVPVEFPTPEVHRIEYDLDDEAEELMDRVIYALEVRDQEQLVVRSGAGRDPRRLSMARYAASVYRLDRDIDRLQVTNVGLLRSMLLKRLESSTSALESTLSRLIESHEAFITALDDGFVIVGDTLKDYASTEAETIEEFLEGLDEKGIDQVVDASEFHVNALRTDVEGDIELLRQLYELANARLEVGPDTKLIELVNDVARIADEADHPDKDGITPRDRRKVIVFSTYAETVVDVHAQLKTLIDEAPAGSVLAEYQGRIAPAIYGSQGGEEQRRRADVLSRFCPMTAGELNEKGEPRSRDQFDILVTTDVLAEGVNLQQAGRMVNYDLPWNPMKLVQRHGRIDRIGSPHKRVYIDCFFPAENLDRLLGLEATLQRKIAYANAAVGVGQVLPGQFADPTVEVLLHDVRAEIVDLYNEDPTLLLEGGGSEALSGEEYRRRLSEALKMSNVRRDVLELPFGSGSGFTSAKVSQPGYVFCARIGDEDKPWFRFVVATYESWQPVFDAAGHPLIFDDTLTCLIAADPGTISGEQAISDEALSRVFDAWALAQKDIYDSWTYLTDPANLEPKVAKALRDAYHLVAEDGAFLGPEQQDLLMAKLNGRWSNSVVKAVRSIIRNEEMSKKKQIEALATFVAEVGLSLPEQPQPLKPVRLDDIRVICWMAVVPENMARPISMAELSGVLPLGDSLLG
jgi:hypothetical protein